MSANQVALWYLIASAFFILALMVDMKTGELKIDRNDDLVAGTLVAADGAVVTRG